MKSADIKARASYLNKSGRSERLVLARGPHVKAGWFGAPETEPAGEDGVAYIDTRMGKTIYGAGSGKKPSTMYVSAFAAWADRMLPDADRADNYSDSDVEKLAADAIKCAAGRTARRD